MVVEHQQQDRCYLPEYGSGLCNKCGREVPPIAPEILEDREKAPCDEHDCEDPIDRGEQLYFIDELLSKALHVPSQSDKGDCQHKSRRGIECKETDRTQFVALE